MRNHDVDGNVTGGAETPGPPPLLRARIAAARGARAHVLPAERAPLMRVELPVRGWRKRLRALPFALEEHLAQPIEQVHCALHPGRTGGAALACVVARTEMPEGDAPVLSEALALPTPDGADGPAWLVWQEDARAVVRASDGTGFASRADALAALWGAAGRPALTVHGDPPPPGLPARHEAGEPPAAESSDLRFDLRQGAYGQDARHWPATLKIAALAAGLGLLAHLGLALADRAALAQVLRAETSALDTRLASRMPGATTALGGDALLARLAPRPPAATGSDFLPLLTRAAAALEAAPALDLRRLTWAADGRLALDVIAGSLEALQAIERALAEAGLAVETGTATAGDGSARAEIRIGSGT
jgi:general secretion pathway protein L